MTKYVDITRGNTKVCRKRTKFEQVLENNGQLVEAKSFPTDYAKVVFVGTSRIGTIFYDVFLAYYKSIPTDATIYFGSKGYEFN